MRYNNYKVSDIELLVEIPSHWRNYRFKDFTKRIQDGTHFTPTYTDNGVNFLSVNDITRNEFDLNKSKYISIEAHKELIKRCKPTKGDILLSKNGTIGIPFIIDFDTEVSIYVSLCLIRLKKDYHNKYFYYILLSDFMFDQYKINAKTNSVSNLHLDKLANFYSIFPPLVEQTAIAQYLDAKTQAIDKKISLLTKKAETYKELRKSIINDAVCKGLDKKVKLKESELGTSIALNFEIKRLKDICKIINGYAFKSNEYLDVGIPVIRIGDIDYNIDFSSVAFVSEEYRILAKESKIKKGDILMAMTGATIGKNSFYNLDKEAYLNQRVCSFRVNKGIDTKYLGHFISSMFFQDSVQLICGGSAQENISKAQLEIFKIIIPPTKEEQTAIANYLDEKTQKIDAIVSNIGKQIDILKELRKTLINDVVTGKIKVANN